MGEQGQVPLQESNISLLGSQIDHEAKFESAETELAFQLPGIGNEGGLWIWRVEDFKLALWPRERYESGEFCEGDSYVVLQSEKVGKKDGKEILKHDIFFWLGVETTQDEAGTAAYKTVELDELLGGGPVQHRELDNYESSAFLGLFPRGFTSLQGGHKSGFHHVSPTSIELSEPRLYLLLPPSQIKQLKLPPSSLSHTAIYLADKGDKTVHWNGSKSSPLLRAKVAQMVRRWTDARAGECTLEVVDDGQGDAPFFSLINVSKVEVEWDDDAHLSRKSVISSIEIYLLPEHGEPSNVDCAGNVKDSLRTSELYILLTKNTVYVWVGQGLDTRRKKFAIPSAQKALFGLRKGGRLPIVKVVEGYEGSQFDKDVGI
ncbi:actin depolymerizing protein [Atractiella rhizophila]|nr:actin depolymerizing protein [Atractiella rhizophila]